MPMGPDQASICGKLGVKPSSMNSKAKPLLKNMFAIFPCELKRARSRQTFAILKNFLLCVNDEAESHEMNVCPDGF